ncbi:MAG: DUF4190 domain-containing protein [Mycobacterium sp.]
MTGPGEDYGDKSHDEAAPFPQGEQPRPWQQYPHPPVDPQAPVNYPEYPPPYPRQPPPVPPYGYPPPPYGGPPGHGGPMGYGGPPGYPVPYDPYQAYQVGPSETNGLAIASLSTSVAGVVLGIPLAIFCYIGLLIPIVGAVLGAVALSQIKRTNQQGRGLAIAGIAVGAVTTAVLLVIWVGVMTVALHSSSIR